MPTAVRPSGKAQQLPPAGAKVDESSVEFESKANLTDVTDEFNPQSLGGNLRLHIEMHDNGEPGDSDTIGFTLWAKNGTLLFSSHCSDVQTLEHVVAGGNLQVR